MTPSVGIHFGVSFDAYRAWDAINIHGLMGMDDSPAHCKWDREHHKDSTEMDVGSAAHVAVFEPARLEKEFYLGTEEYNATTKEGKAIRDHEMEIAAGRKYIRRKAGDAVDCDSVKGMAASLWQHTAARRFLEMPGQCEASALWKDPLTGLLCKGRFDKFVPSAVSPFKRPVVVELKSLGKGKARPDRFGKEAAKWHYSEQATYYTWGVKELTGESPIHVFLLAENVAPYVANWGTFDDLSLQTGALRFRRWLDAYAECVRSQKWPGYPEKVDGKAPIFSLPKWTTYES